MIFQKKNKADEHIEETKTEESEVSEKKMEDSDGSDKKSELEDKSIGKLIAKYAKEYLVVIVFLGIFLMSGVISSSMTSGISQEVEEQHTEINNLSNKIKTKSAETKAIKQDIVKSTTGYNPVRAAEDDEAFRGFMKVVCTWDNYSEYNTARNRLISDYGLDEKSDFMTIFMPHVNNIVENGKNHNIIDTYNYNMKFDSMQSYVTHIGADIYTYFTVVDTVTSSKQVKGGEAVSRCIVTYDMDAEHNISRISALPVY